MSLPSSEPLPDDIHELPPARQRHLRRMPRAASPAEWEILLESLLNLTRPTLEFFLLSLLGAAASGAALYFNEPLLLIVALVLLPFINPIFNLALYPASRKLGYALKSLISPGRSDRSLVRYGSCWSVGSRRNPALTGWP